MAICLRSSGSPEQSRLEFQAPAWPKHLGWWKAEYLQARQAGSLDVQPLIFSESWNFGNLGVWASGSAKAWMPATFEGSKF